MRHRCHCESSRERTQRRGRFFWFRRLRTAKSQRPSLTRLNLTVGDPDSGLGNYLLVTGLGSAIASLVLGPAVFVAWAVAAAFLLVVFGQRR